MMIVSIGLSIFLRNVYQYVAGGRHPQLLPVRQRRSRSHFGPMLFTTEDVLVAVIASRSSWRSCVALQRPGSARPPARSPTTRRWPPSSGINVDRVITVVWIGGAALAGLSGVLLGLTQGFDYQLGLQDPAAGLRRRHARRSRHHLGRDRRRVRHRHLHRGLHAVHPGGAQVRRRAGRADPRPAGPPQGILGRRAAGRVGGRTTWTGRDSARRGPATGLGPAAVVYCLAAIGLNVHFGYTGLLNFGQAALHGRRRLRAWPSFVATWGLPLLARASSSGSADRRARPAARRPHAAAARRLPGDRDDRGRRDHPADGRLGQPAGVLRRPGRPPGVLQHASATSTRSPARSSIGVAGHLAAVRLLGDDGRLGRSSRSAAWSSGR